MISSPSDQILGDVTKTNKPQEMPLEGPVTFMVLSSSGSRIWSGGAQLVGGPTLKREGFTPDFIQYRVVPSSAKCMI